MAIDGLPEGVSPSGRVPEQLLQGAPILKRRRRRNREGFAKKGSCLGVSTPRGKYRRRGASRGPTGQPGGCPARPRVGAAPGTLLAPWWWLRFPHLVIPEASVALIFYIIFLEFLGHFKYRENLKYKK